MHVSRPMACGQVCTDHMQTPGLFCAAGELLMAVRQHASTMHDRDGLMETAFEGVGSLPMAAIERYREQRTAEVQAAVRERQAMRNRQQLQHTLSAKQKTANMAEVGEQMDGMKLNAQLREAGKQAEVLGKQAASNIKKGFGAFMQGAKELSSKAQAEINKRSSKPGHGSDGGAGADEMSSGATGSRQAGKPAQVPEEGIAAAVAAARGGDEDELL
eukprot:GHUV01048989.1.p1 GENE.GHUV01048989.1~~GHUV01048989.1.p1  ORF type:complete len:216 (+),score=108.10 GHUV01048989.1:1654-2301(+)